MEKYCTNCGHANSGTNRVCVECGKPLTLQQQKVPVLKKAKKPMSFKNKLVIGVTAVLLASLFGLYTWGTKTASAESTVAKFFEALKEKDAATLPKYIALSNGDEVTEKEAAAFIDLYQDLTPDELYEMATVEKNGKVAGIFDAHKVIITPQELSFYFPYDGLSLELNGKPAKMKQHDNGDYVFSGIVPGNYEAEFVFDDEKTEFIHQFNLTVEYQWDSSYITTIDEDLPLGSTVFQVTIDEYSPSYETKIIMGDKEFLVDEYGETEETGPFLLDGSMKAVAKVDFPWGSATSEEVLIDDEYINIDISKLDEKVEEQLIDQLTLFLEEQIQASGTRDASVYTTITPGLLEYVTETLESWKESGYFFKGSLTKINMDEDSVRLLSEDGKVVINTEVETEGAFYYQSEHPDIDKNIFQFSVTFIYNTEKKKWLVEEFSSDQYYDSSLRMEPTRTIEGSKKVFEIKGSSDSVKETIDEPNQSADQPVVDERDEEDTEQTEDIEAFMYLYNSLSVIAMNSGDFSMVSHLISEDGPKWQESADYIDYIYEKGITEEHLGTTLEKVEEIDDRFVKVTTIDRFIIHGTEESSERKYRSVNILKKNEDSWLVNELVATNEI